MSDNSSSRPTPSDDFHVTVQLPFGDGLAELPLFPFTRRGIVIDEGVAEQIAGGPRALELAGGLHQGARQLPLRRMLLLVAVALDRLAGIDLVRDAPKARSDGRGKRQVRVRVGRGNAIFDPRRFRRA